MGPQQGKEPEEKSRPNSLAEARQQLAPKDVISDAEFSRILRDPSSTQQQVAQATLRHPPTLDMVIEAERQAREE